MELKQAMVAEAGNWCCVLLQVREVRLLRQLSLTMKQAGAAGGFFDAWMKHNSDLVQATATAYGGEHCLCMIFGV
jgi:hypothetical protein